MQINLTPDPSLLAIMAIFLLNYLIVRRFFLQPITRVIEEREGEAKTAEGIYEDALARFNAATTEMETQLHGAKREAAQLRDRFRAEAGAHRAQVIERTQGEAKTIVQAAEGQLSADVEEARTKIQRESEQLARIAAERILGRPI